MLSGFLSNFVREYPIKLKIGMLDHIILFETPFLDICQCFFNGSEVSKVESSSVSFSLTLAEVTDLLFEKLTLQTLLLF